jgi:hypothetical protein
MSLIGELDDLLWAEKCEFTRHLNRDQWDELEIWCDETFGKYNWFWTDGKMHFRQTNQAVIFLLRWS